MCSFYLIRENSPVGAPQMLAEFGCTKAELGWAFTAFALISGFGKFFPESFATTQMPDGFGRYGELDLPFVACLLEWQILFGF
jgi:sugar phosphate permease